MTLTGCKHSDEKDLWGQGGVGFAGSTSTPSASLGASPEWSAEPRRFTPHDWPCAGGGPARSYARLRRDGAPMPAS
jgi:hypothetical protein